MVGKIRLRNYGVEFLVLFFLFLFIEIQNNTAKNLVFQNTTSAGRRLQCGGDEASIQIMFGVQEFIIL